MSRRGQAGGRGIGLTPAEAAAAAALVPKPARTPVHFRVRLVFNTDVARPQPHLVTMQVLTSRDDFVRFGVSMQLPSVAAGKPDWHTVFRFVYENYYSALQTVLSASYRVEPFQCVNTAAIKSATEWKLCVIDDGYIAYPL